MADITEGCGEWLTTKNNRTSKQDRERHAAQKVLATAAKRISKTSLGLDIKWSWNPLTPRTKQKIHRTKQTRIDRFLKPQETPQQQVAIGARHKDRNSWVRKTTKLVPLKRHRKADISQGDSLAFCCFHGHRTTRGLSLEAGEGEGEGEGGGEGG